jgi:hypothetical protein
MEPVYMNENRYTYLVGSYRASSTGNYQAESPETQFEKEVQALYLDGQEYLHREEYYLALQSFQELMALILHIADPEMPIDPNVFPVFAAPLHLELLDVLANTAATILEETPVIRYEFPPALVSERSILPGPVLEELKPALQSGLHITSHHAHVGEHLQAALSAVEKEQWRLANRHYALALEKTPDSDILLRASLFHDVAVLQEKAGNQEKALEAGKRSLQLFAGTKVPEAQVHALDTASGILRRAGKIDEAETVAKRATEIRRTTNINPILSAEPSPTVRPYVTRVMPFLGDAGLAGLPGEGDVQVRSTADAPKLMAMKYVPAEQVTKSLVIMGAETQAAITLGDHAAENVKGFLQTVADTVDLEMIMGYYLDPVQLVAYLPHMYFFAIPMSIGDCLAGMGNLQEAAKQYLSVLPYPFINRKYEIVKLWTRLAQVYLARADLAYRRAKDDSSKYTAAREIYELIVQADGTLDANSPLYKDSKFASIKARVENFVAAADRMAVKENPAITIRVLDALSKLGQIGMGLNFFGFGPDYVPPFSFQYLQNTAQYFAKQASQIEQRYIQFKSQAENEELRREQLDQQAEVARQTVILEERGVAEAQAAVGVAEANLNYTEVRRQNAVQAKADFAAVRWELLELSQLEAWANAASVDADDEVMLEVPAEYGYRYYTTASKRRSHVVQELSARRTRISHDLESDKLQRAINDAVAYKAVAQAQVDQANARLAVTRQRVEVAKLQQRHAEENRDFLDMKEFSARLWYELALVARGLKQRYLDMATEIAFLMERAYNAETERGLSVIRYDYSNSATNNLMGADMLLADIDYLTYDHLTTVTTKKNPVKRVISLADFDPMAFHQLLQTGDCAFATALEDFDREFPGLYLCKLRNVEVVFVGLTGSGTVVGSLRNAGVSQFRLADGSVVARSYPADVMAISNYEIRQDALAFRVNPNDLRLFENNGIATLWQLSLPADANDLDFRDILDVQLVLYFDGFWNPTLESTIRAALPGTGTASRGISMRMSFPDEMYYLKHQGDAELSLDAGMFPRTQRDLVRTLVTLKALGKPGTVDSLTLRLTSANHGVEIVATTDAQGEINDSTPGAPLDALKNEAMLDDWTIQITAADNALLVVDGALDLSGLDDILMFFEYSFTYR